MTLRKIAPFVLLMLAGCVPNATSYYHPAMEGGRVLSRHCVPTESIVEFGELPLRASVSEANNSWLVLLGLPAKRPPTQTWQTFRFSSSDFRVRYLDGGMSDTLPISVLRDDKSDSAIEPYRPPRPDGWLYALDVRLPGPPPVSFELIMPALLIDGREVRYPPLRFERKTWMGISPFNC